MREKIAKIINDQARRYENTGYVCAGEILTLLREEIERVALTREEVWEAYRADESSGDVVGIAEAQLQKILDLLEERR